MNRSRVLMVGVASAVAIGAGVLALAQNETGARSDGSPSGAPGQRDAGAPGGREASVGGGMRAMNRAAKVLARQIGDASKREENLKLINDMQRGCVTAKGLPVPKDVLEKAPDAAASAALTREFHGRLLGVLRALVDLETAFTEGNIEEAKARFASIRELEAEGHKVMGLEEE